VVENFVGTPEHLYLLDWEYAALGMAGMDYAALAAEWNIGAETLANQTGLPPGLLAVSKELYRYLCDLWETANAR
jgi:thiamine kinase-like enzyme